MKSITIAEGNTVYQIVEINGKQRKYKVRVCNTPQEPVAVAHYYNIRPE